MDAADQEGLTDLMWAASNGNAEVVSALLERGASPDKSNNEGNNAWYWTKSQPIMKAIFKRHLAKVEGLDTYFLRAEISATVIAVLDGAGCPRMKSGIIFVVVILVRQ